MSNQVYEASVHTQVISYKNFKGEIVETELHFALDPLQLLQVIAEAPVRTSKSANPTKRDKIEFSDGDQLKFVRDLANKAAGFPSEDGESWEPFPEFADSLAGKAFMTKLTASDPARQEFAQKVILDPFRAFVSFARAEETNTKGEIEQLETMLKQFENVFTTGPTDETFEQRKARLLAEMAALEKGSEQ